MCERKREKGIGERALSKKREIDQKSFILQFLSPIRQERTTYLVEQKKNLIC